MILGFTGTRQGLALAQKHELARLIAYLAPTEAHHGDCQGADSEFHELIRAGQPKAKLVIHPPTAKRYRAYCDGDIILPTKPYLNRDRDIVAACGHLLACPSGYEDQPHSGTWYTVRHALRIMKPVTVIYPDGSFDTYFQSK